MACGPSPIPREGLCAFFFLERAWKGQTTPLVILYKVIPARSPAASRLNDVVILSLGAPERIEEEQ